MNHTTFVLFGATGDLAKRKIYPALYHLYIHGKLPESFAVIGLGRKELSDETFRAHVKQSLHDFYRLEVKDDETLQSFLGLFGFNILHIDRQADFVQLKERVERREQGVGGTSNRMFYLSVAPNFFGTIASQIEQSGLGSVTGWKRLVIEKPFGHDLVSARELNSQLSQAFTEDEIYRIDHYLGKPMVQRLEALKQANPVIQALWSSRYIANVQITADETVGVEERAGYYDQAGAVRDMFQNHMLQLLMMLSIHVSNGNAKAVNIRSKKKNVLESLEPLARQDVHRHIVRGQYAAGAIQGKEVIGYTSESGISPDSMNDTFIAAKLQIDNYNWRGVPFYIRTGKRLKSKNTRIVIEFKEPLGSSTPAKDSSVPNLLVFEIGPNEGITLLLNTNDPNHKGEFKQVHIDMFPDRMEAEEAYETLIHDALNGDSTFFVHWDEVDLSWQWVQPILEAFAAKEVPLYSYEAGSNGPEAANELLARDGFHWWFDDEPSEYAAPGVVNAEEVEKQPVEHVTAS
ncbi:glucose-6-phosphate dehydrogenase [Paenibacillus azoreducens]|uniref:Glucose-6-phosphate 1-dehydrogenase n=1 Tax=Paenibacillus azoreducens TaxID=116718 RepID=A0A919Y7L3_9BACL|nr:glucose-6-phosphate dehydrogenase [Paenibacillus azoreducens]GIO45284.1 glucose-6-phosphate 1-dehydrogenase [Paenibacillus azoreducens]